MTDAPTSGTPAPHTATDTGTAAVDDDVISQVAGIAASGVAGVHALGGGAARAVGAVRGLAGASSAAQGVAVEVAEARASVDVTVVAEYPTALRPLAEEVRRAVTQAVETIVGLEVTAVNIRIDDVHVPEDDSDDSDDTDETAKGVDATAVDADDETRPQ